MKISPDIMNEGVYNARDVLSTCRVYPFLIDAVERSGCTQVYEVDEQMAHLALQMTRVGMPVSASERKRAGDHLRELRDQAATDLEITMELNWESFLTWVAKLQASKIRKNEPALGTPQFEGGPAHSEETSFYARVEIRKEQFRKLIEKHGWAKKGLNLGAKIQQAALLRASGVPLTKTTLKSAIPKVDKEVLEDMRQFPAAKAFLQWSLTSAALRNFVDNLDLDENGFMHPEWEIHKISGRWGSKPNVQNWSKRAGGGVENLRKMIVAPDGYTFVGADQKQLEARLIAADSGDPFLKGVFERNEDIHSAMAGVAFPTAWPKAAETYIAHKKTKCGPSDLEPKCDMCKQRDKIRDLTKRLEYGGFYGGTDQTLHESCVKDFPELKRGDVVNFLANFNKQMPRVMAWRVDILEQATKEGEIRSPILGRRECFPMGRVEPTVAYNFRPQSGGADLWDLGAIEFCKRWDQRTWDARICHNGHDSVLILCREDVAPKVVEDVHACWERDWNGVQFLMDTKVGKSWADV
jgi:DNA polymerase I-like protein with 3'-5' exonuclease and polymerase domains